METIPVRCFTNLDDYKMTVHEVASKPSIGERVICNHIKNGYQSLRIVMITHSQDTNGKPFLLIELNH